MVELLHQSLKFEHLGHKGSADASSDDQHKMEANK